MLIDILKAQFSDVWQIDLQSVMNDLYDVINLVASRLFDKHFCSLSKLFLGAEYGILISGLDKRDYCRG